MVLDRLDRASKPEDLNVSGLHFHQLGGDRRGTYSVRITANWRLTFEWSGDDAVSLDYEGYH